ncbi:hypothetical protein PVAP13_9KG156685 [Panicum virgatum]|uniref:Uncharacterized protein n=1 Tax=Panicum virgatum TaxID=38727 RepID=A0A8T0NM98_PANVG|nr:hypothetical protein PVAP13_9KG156685 [Panicum virgatum]
MADGKGKDNPGLNAWCSTAPAAANQSHTHQVEQQPAAHHGGALVVHDSPPHSMGGASAMDSWSQTRVETYTTWTYGSGSEDGSSAASTIESERSPNQANRLQNERRNAWLSALVARSDTDSSPPRTTGEQRRTAARTPAAPPPGPRASDSEPTPARSPERVARRPGRRRRAARPPGGTAARRRARRQQQSPSGPPGAGAASARGVPEVPQLRLLQQRLRVLRHGGRRVARRPARASRRPPADTAAGIKS